jgi:hypothetical protein
MRLVQRKQALGRTPRLRWQVLRQLRPRLAHFTLSIRLADPFPQGTHRHIQLIGYVLDAAGTSLPDFAQSLFLQFN